MTTPDWDTSQRTPGSMPAGRETVAGPDAAAVARRARAWDTALLAAVLVCTFLLGCSPLEDTDVWWHLKTGQLMLERHNVPIHDWYTFTNPTKNWTDLHWGFQILAAVLYAAGGISLLILVKAGCLTLTVLVGWKAAGDDLPAWGKALCWTLAILCFLERAWIRPEMLTLIFLALWLYIFQRAEQKQNLIRWLPLIQLVWTNCHALFVLGFVVGGAYVVDRLIRQIARGRWGLVPPPQFPGVQQLLLVAIFTFAASLVNPYAEEGLLFPLELYRKFTIEKAFYQTRVLEFEPLDALWRRIGAFGPRSICLWAEAVLFIATAVSFVLLGRERRWNPGRLVLFAAFTHLAWAAVRNISLFGLVCGVILCANGSDVIRLSRRRRNEPGGQSPVEPEELQAVLPLRRRLLTPAACLLFVGWSIAIVTGVWSDWSHTGLKFGLGSSEHSYIHSAAKFAGQPGFPQRAFVADWGQAGVYIFHNAPERTVFMDGRLEVNSQETHRQYEEILMAMAAGDPRWPLILRDGAGNSPAVILDTLRSQKEIQGVFNTPGWRLVYADRIAAVFLDRTTADRLKLPAVDPKRFVEGD